MNKKMFAPRVVERGSLKRKIMVHMAMLYECEDCGNVFKFWLEKGLEDRMQDTEHPNLHKPVPYITACLCGGNLKHKYWGSDERLGEYRELLPDENYFENIEDERCGISHFRNGGIKEERRIVRFNPPEPFYIPKPEPAFLQELLGLTYQQQSYDAEKERREMMEAEAVEADAENDPYGLAHVSTTTLKKELRRRKGGKTWIDGERKGMRNDCKRS